MIVTITTIMSIIVIIAISYYVHPTFTSRPLFVSSY